MRQRVARLERRDDAFLAGAERERPERVLVRGGHVLHPADIVQPGMLRADPGVVEPGRDRVRLGDLTVVVLQQVGAVAVQYPGAPAAQRGGVAAAVEAEAAGLDAADLDAGVAPERVGREGKRR